MTEKRAALALLVTTALTGAVMAGGSSAASASATQTTQATVRHTEAEVTSTAHLTKLAQRAVDAGAPGVIVRVDGGHGPATEIVRQAPWTRSGHVLHQAVDPRGADRRGGRARPDVRAR
ncbi:hypothetical protein [Nonomuraea sp. NEAU-A123]|uniref:hypothetical protein n=1 Tax=Nonomuraea sp. NEAU-A123 TaxID=2839649 RepID=UPI001BE42E50|nr:hypothetical protein [Nonomuraea sp. NEAU-A123]MBT2231912.1 hypothetical protein [Nonomuraea sp. NEAU-A123]